MQIEFKLTLFDDYADHPGTPAKLCMTLTKQNRVLPKSLEISQASVVIFEIHQIQHTMKTRFDYRWLVLMTGAALVFNSCKKDETVAPAGLASSTIQGTWAIATSEGTEWKKGVGIFTPRAAATDMIGYKIVLSGTMITVKDISGAVIYGPVSFTLNESAKTITIGANANTGLGLFNIPNFVAGATMSWDQREPVDADYTPKSSCSCELYFQKFWTMTKVP